MNAYGVDEDDQAQGRHHLRQGDVVVERADGQAYKQHARDAETETKEADLPDQVSQANGQEQGQNGVLNERGGE